LPDCATIYGMEHSSTRTPQAFAALDAFPALRASVAASLDRQVARIAAYLSRFQERPNARSALDAALMQLPGGCVALCGPPGSGVTSLLASLAVRYPAPIWLAADDAGMGAQALYAQILALYRPAVPLIDPATATDPLVLERLLAEASSARRGDTPLVLLVDAPETDRLPLALPLPPDLPPGVTLVYGCATPDALPYVPHSTIWLPELGEPLQVYQGALTALGCPAAYHDLLITAAQGNFFYFDLAVAGVQAGQFSYTDLPLGLAGLLGRWWETLVPAEQDLAVLLAAVGEPVPVPLLAQMSSTDPLPLLGAWEALGLVDLTLQMIHTEVQDLPTVLAGYGHSAVRSWLCQTQASAVTQAHATLATVCAAQRSARAPEAPATQHYARRQVARHWALGPSPAPREQLGQVTTRAWLADHERHKSLDLAHTDAAWALQAAVAAGDPVRMTLAAALVGTLATRARTLSADAAVAALQIGLERSGREAALKRVLDVVERLPDGDDKAHILRRVGEACYEARMRQSAMRLLSRALDLEANPTSRAWRDQREQLLAALAEALIAHHALDDALAIAEQIEHLERRAVVETQAARALLRSGDRDRAQRVARGILHESMGAWACAEVAVALVRAADQRGALMLADIANETALAWAQIELACDLVVHDPVAARARIAELPNVSQQDRGLARLAVTQAQHGDITAAIATTQQITAPEVRLTALIDLQQVEGGGASLAALTQATADLDALAPDDRAPLLVALAAAFAALGQMAQALRLVLELPEGEERDRGRARTAVALTRRGDYTAALRVLDALTDDDERDWARDEMVRLLAADGLWDSALTLINAIAAPDQRARTNADLAIERGRAGDPQAALALALAVEDGYERARALALLAPLLVQAGATNLAQGIVSHADALAGSEARSRYLAALTAALVASGDLAAATAVRRQIQRPVERGRAALACAQALVATDPQAACQALGEALCATAIGREEVLRMIEWAAPVIADLGGAPFVRQIADGVVAFDRR
jgi:tetratricopeptide (TPR) repeat protein